MDFDEKLIEEVKNYDFIYNLKSPDYKNTLKKEEAWRVIAGRLHSNGDTCKKRWRNLRDVYKKIKQREEVRSGSAAPETKRPYKYYNMLSFLDCVQSVRKTCGNVSEDDVIILDNNSADIANQFNELPSTSTFCAESPEALEDSLCSNASENPRKRKRDDLKEQFTSFFVSFCLCFTSFLRASKICSNYEEKQKDEDNSTRLLFAALESRIRSANLSSDQLMDLEINTAAFVYQKLAELQRKS